MQPQVACKRNFKWQDVTSWLCHYVFTYVSTMSQEPSLRYFSPCWKISWWLHQSTSHLHWQTSIECQHCSVVTMLSHSKQLYPTLSAAVMIYIYIMIAHRSWHRSKPRELSFSSVAVQSALFLLLMPWRLTAAYMSMWCQYDLSMRLSKVIQILPDIPTEHCLTRCCSQ